MMKGRLTLRFEKRDTQPLWLRIANPIICVVVALLLIGLLAAALGFDTIKAYGYLFSGAFGTAYGLSESLLQAITLLLCGLGVAIANKMSINNIGAEGQYVMGAWAACGIGVFCPWIPQPLVLPCMVVGGFIAGAVWGMLAVFPKAKWGVNETIITLLFNYIALLWIDFWVYGPWRDTSGPNLPFSPKVPAYAAFGTIGGTRVNTALFIGLAAALLMYFFFSKTVRGYQIRVIGANGRAARYAGMNVSLNIMLVMLMSGGLAGVAGVAQVGGAAARLQPNIAGGAGYTAIIIGYISKFNPFIIVLVSFLFGGLMQGSYSLQMAGMPWQMTQMLQGAILFCVLSGEIFSRSRVIVKWERCEGKSIEVQEKEGASAC